MSSASATETARGKYRALLTAASKTAGSDNWKTTAGRVDGSDGFVVGDAWRLLKIRFKSTSKPSVCPVCMDKPSSDDDWYITKSCKHAVCKECLQNYAMSLISDVNHSGPLKCPCCPRLLRVEDAQVALGKQLRGATKTVTLSKRDVMPGAAGKHLFRREGLLANAELDDTNGLDVLEKWDNKSRDEFLRSMRDFRPCPHCSKGSGVVDGDSSSNGSSDRESALPNKGGGFVTPGCLGPINEERETKAERLLDLAGTSSSKAVLLTYAVYCICCGSLEFKNPILQIISAVVPCVLLPVLPHALQLFLASMAKVEFMRPIIVTCPCCNKDFNLEASSEFELPGASSDTAAEEATQHWKNTNTRPCPGCASPIMKAGGCNHVKCGKCRVDFCWACMRPRTTCRAYNCTNGAPYGNAFGDGSREAVREGLTALEMEQQGQTLLERIDHVEATAMRHLRMFRSFPWQYAAIFSLWCIVVTCLANLGHDLAMYKWSAIVSLALLLLLPSLGIICIGIVYWIISYNVRQMRWNIRGVVRREQRQNGTPVNLWPANRIQNRRFMPFRLLGLRSEEEQLAEAIARSLNEQ